MSKTVTLEEVLAFLRNEVSLNLTDAETRELATRFKTLSIVSKEADSGIDFLKPELIERNAQEFFPEDGQKVVVTEGKTLSETDTKALFDYLFKAGRMWDFVKVASVSQTSLGQLEDSTVLIKMFVKETGKAKPSCSLKEMTKNEKATAEANRRLSL